MDVSPFTREILESANTESRWEILRTRARSVNSHQRKDAIRKAVSEISALASQIGLEQVEFSTPLLFFEAVSSESGAHFPDYMTAAIKAYRLMSGFSDVKPEVASMAVATFLEFYTNIVAARPHLLIPGLPPPGDFALLENAASSHSYIERAGAVIQAQGMLEQELEDWGMGGRGRVFARCEQAAKLAGFVIPVSLRETISSVRNEASHRPVALDPAVAARAVRVYAETVGLLRSHPKPSGSSTVTSDQRSVDAGDDHFAFVFTAYLELDEALNQNGFRKRSGENLYERCQRASRGTGAWIPPGLLEACHASYRILMQRQQVDRQTAVSTAANFMAFQKVLSGPDQRVEDLHRSDNEWNVVPAIVTLGLLGLIVAWLFAGAPTHYKPKVLGVDIGVDPPAESKPSSNAPGATEGGEGAAREDDKRARRARLCSRLSEDRAKAANCTEEEKAGPRH